MKRRNSYGTQAPDRISRVLDDLHRKRMEAGGQFVKDSVGAKWLIREMVDARIKGMEIMEKLRRGRA